MRSDSAAGAELVPQNRGAGVSPLLDSVFGFIAWAVHLLIVYVSTAVACQIGLGSREASVQSAVVITLIAITILAAAIVVAHAVRRYSQRREMRGHGFLARIAVGHDAVAVLAILWQLMPLTMVPLCR